MSRVHGGPPLSAQRPAVCYFRRQTMSIVISLVIFALVVLLTLALAYVPMRLLVAQMARNVRSFIQRQRERRAVERGTPDRRGERSA